MSEPEQRQIKKFIAIFILVLAMVVLLTALTALA